MHQAAINVVEVKQSVAVFVDNESISFGVIPPQPNLQAGIVIGFDNGLTPIGEGAVCDITIPFTCIITSVDLIAPNQAGDCSVDLAITSFADYPSGFTSIVDATPPVLSNSQKYQDTDLTGWTTGLSKGQRLRATVTGVVDLTKISLTLSATKIVQP